MANILHTLWTDSRPKSTGFCSHRRMLDHPREAVAMGQGKTRTDLDRDRQLNLALVRLVEIIGEAASHVPSEVTARYPQLPWQQIVSLRNRLIHGYYEVDFDILWQIITHDLPPLVGVLDQILRPRD